MATHVVATRKANGEAAHLSCIEIGGQLLICAGSKNVHMLFSTRGKYCTGKTRNLFFNCICV